MAPPPPSAQDCLGITITELWRWAGLQGLSAHMHVHA